jgi:DHA1 family bicyclomycin/chloramphenicol resistance-like MFS transporter
MRRFGVRPLIGGGTGALAAASLLLAALVFGGMTALWPLILLTITLFLCLGVILAPAFLTAMEPFGATAGAAAALGVGMEFTISSVTTALMGLTADGTARPMVGFIALVSCCSFGTWVVFMKTTRPAHRPS